MEKPHTEYNHQVARNTFTWGTYGKDGFRDDYFKRILLKDLNNIHLLRILVFINHMNSLSFTSSQLYDDKTKFVIEQELKFRKLDKLLIEKI